MIFMISLALGGPLLKSFDERLGTFYLLQYVFAIRVVVYSLFYTLLRDDKI